MLAKIIASTHHRPYFMQNIFYVAESLPRHLRRSEIQVFNPITDLWKIVI